jgi:hypothetical protein
MVFKRYPSYTGSPHLILTTQGLHNSSSLHRVFTPYHHTIYSLHFILATQGDCYTGSGLHTLSLLHMVSHLIITTQGCTPYPRHRGSPPLSLLLRVSTPYPRCGCLLTPPESFVALIPTISIICFTLSIHHFFSSVSRFSDYPCHFRYIFIPHISNTYPGTYKNSLTLLWGRRQGTVLLILTLKAYRFGNGVQWKG